MFLGQGITHYKNRGEGVFGAAYSNSYSLLLDGVNEYVNIDSVQTALATTTQGTWFGWFKPVDATPATQSMLISFGDTNASSDIVLTLTTAGKLTAFAREAAVFQWLLEITATAFTDNTWSSFALVSNGVSPVLYVNGVAAAQTFSTSTDKTFWFNDIAGLDNGRIGNRSFNSVGETLFLNGNIDEVLFTNDAKSAAEILAMHNNGCPKDESAITNGVSLFRFENDTVSTAIDSIGSNNGTYVNVEQADIELDVIC
jgi:hypothetical protein